MQKVLPLLCEIMTATEFLVETLLWIQQLTQKVVCSSATLLPIPHPVEIYFEFCVTRYRQARKLAFVLVLIYLDFICLFLVWFFFFLAVFLVLLGIFCFYFFIFEERKSVLVAFLSFCAVYPCHLSCDSGCDPQIIHRRNAFLGQSPPYLATICLQGWESNSFSVPILTGQSSWQDVSAYCHSCS